SKSIQSIQSVQSARVHLVVPKRELFSKNQALPSASIVLKMRGNQRLSANQIQAVQALVSTAVLNMTNDRISIIDDKGTLLSRGRDASSMGDNASILTAMKEEYEEKTARQLEQLLEKTLGPDQARVEMTVEMDFDKVTSQSVDYNPDGQVLKTVTTLEEGSNSSEGNRDAVTIQNAIPNQENAAGANTPTSTTSKSEETRNFEISNKTTTIVKEVGAIKRLSVAVLVNGSYEKDEKGALQYKPRSEEEINQINELIKTAVGFQENREDSIKVVNLRFSHEPEQAVSFVEPAFWEYYIKTVDKRKAIELAIIGLFGLLIILGFIKPLVMRMMQLSQPMNPSVAGMSNDNSSNLTFPVSTAVSDELSLLDRIEQQ
ncbi:MAG: flagellar basal-body MS-ring/collar protein FliF, partial [Alphaproteobacteria bacterium]|nr:flagellar basal-body MS-ring/collar protein FliF [Alphaproteobacteria bacterium]